MTLVPPESPVLLIVTTVPTDSEAGLKLVIVGGVRMAISPTVSLSFGPHTWVPSEGTPKASMPAAMVRTTVAAEAANVPPMAAVVSRCGAVDRQNDGFSWSRGKFRQPAKTRK